MKKALYFSLLLASVVAAFRLGSQSGRRTVTPASAEARKVLYYVDPMHPAYKSDKPGIAPDCGMQLEPVYAGPQLTAAALAQSSSLQPGSVRIDPAKQQLFGVRVSPVEETSGSYSVRLVGRVAPDEARTYKLNAGIEGYIQEVSPATTGSFVHKNQVLAAFAAPNASMTLQTYVLNLGAEDRFKKSAAEGSVEGQSVASVNANLQLRAQQLQNLGMSVLQMEEIRRTRQIPDTIKIVSPVDGFILARNMSPGQKFERDTEWYRIADLRRVWIMADVFESESQHLRAGARVRISLPNQNKVFAGRISDVLPQFDATSKTLKARIEVENPGYLLRPDMLVDVELPVTFPRTIVVPATAVLDSGLKKTVFVERSEGSFSPRSVETGRRFADRVEIVKGLQAGERIVVSGNFLISSESRLQEATETYAPITEPAPADHGVNAPAASEAQAGSGKSGPGNNEQTRIASRRGRRRG
ncbi:MAG TPA: efflux RND transporter periplasmic adaptor subunit [Candidatus Angelobacter sp.]|nr:efflux RND transporter periplasmic adaptor subunit [Candidatus Angelobacter sp.]